MTKRILIVDDDLKNKKLVKDILEANSFLTSEAINGKEAIEIAIDQMPDLILMDLQMPVMDGFSAIKFLKTNDDTNHIPIIALTALFMNGDKEKVLLNGADDYLSKPISIKPLLGLINKYIGNKETGDNV